ncbi:MAG: hypothetical protein AAGK02_01740 [Pseudomonadota bacterium]
MIDYFALALGHGLLVIAFLNLVRRDELDVDPALDPVAGRKSAGDRARDKRKAARTNAAHGNDQADDDAAKGESA